MRCTCSHTALAHMYLSTSASVASTCPMRVMQSEAFGKGVVNLVMGGELSDGCLCGQRRIAGGLGSISGKI